MSWTSIPVGAQSISRLKSADATQKLALVEHARPVECIGGVLLPGRYQVIAALTAYIAMESSLPNGKMIFVELMSSDQEIEKTYKWKWIPYLRGYIPTFSIRENTFKLNVIYY